MENHMKKLDNP